MDELPNCPLCGSKAELYKDEYGTELYLPIVTCSNYGCPNWGLYITEVEWTAAARSGEEGE
jgi:hypothetical protein